MSTGPNTRICEWHDCDKEGRYRIQTSSSRDDIHWFCQLHARTFDLSVVNQGPFIGAAGPNWTQKRTGPKPPPNNYQASLHKNNPNVRMRHISGSDVLKYSREDLQYLKTLGLESGAKSEDIKKAYKKLVKHCHPDQNPELEDGEYIFNKINEAYNALKDKEFK